MCVYLFTSHAVVWGYDEQDMHMLLQMMKGTDSASMEVRIASPFTHFILTGRATLYLTFLPCPRQDTVTGRVAGLTCTHVLNGHSSAVSGLALVQGDKLTSHLVRMW